MIINYITSLFSVDPVGTVYVVVASLLLLFATCFLVYRLVRGLFIAIVKRGKIITKEE